MWGRHVDQRNRLRRQPVRRKTTEHVNPMLLVYDVRHRFVERLSGIAVPNACHGYGPEFVSADRPSFVFSQTRATARLSR